MPLLDKLMSDFLATHSPQRMTQAQSMWLDTGNGLSAKLEINPKSRTLAVTVQATLPESVTKKEGMTQYQRKTATNTMDYTPEAGFKALTATVRLLIGKAVSDFLSDVGVVSRR